MFSFLNFQTCTWNPVHIKKPGKYHIKTKKKADKIKDLPVWYFQVKASLLQWALSITWHFPRRCGATCIFLGLIWKSILPYLGNSINISGTSIINVASKWITLYTYMYTYMYIYVHTRINTYIYTYIYMS